MAFAENFAPYLDLDGFAVEAEWLSPLTGEKKTVRVIFDNGYGEAFDGLAGSQQPTALCESEDVTGIAQDDTLTIADVEYTVTNVEPDGTGMTTLRLRAV